MGEMHGQPVRFVFGGEYIVCSINEQYRHREALKLLAYIKIVNDG
jgi:hypothetical protein